MRKKVKKFITTPKGVERRTVEPGTYYYSQGPKPRTERGKRRHQRRTESQAAHAKAVWDGKA